MAIFDDSRGAYERGDDITGGDTQASYDRVKNDAGRTFGGKTFGTNPYFGTGYQGVDSSHEIDLIPAQDPMNQARLPLWF